MDNYLIYYGLTFLALIITVGAQIYVESSYKKYLKVKNGRGLSGFDAARAILDKNGLEKVHIVETGGHLSDHYDPSRKVVRLSHDVFHGESIASVAVACHECGHAIQDKEGYSFMRIRSAIFPLVNFSSYAGYIAILIGIIFGSSSFITIGILLEVIILIFQLVTLPVEFDASRRALKELDYGHFLNSKELEQGKKVLKSAAFTYVASVCAAILEILRLILIYGGRRED